VKSGNHGRREMVAFCSVVMAFSDLEAARVA
jgi:hypothetical protein